MRNMKATILMATVLFVSGPVAQAQQDQPYFHAGWKMLGAQAFQGQQHAQDRAQRLYYYNQIPKTMPKSKEDAKDLIAGIKKDLADSNTAHDKLKAEFAKNKEAVDLIESIKKHHAKVHELCGMAEEACAKQHEGEDVVLGDCCADMWSELDAAKAETTKLLKLLKIDKLEPPKKAEPKKAAPKK
jgi:hypothetical protein